MKAYHTSLERIEKIEDREPFGDCLFFSWEPYSLRRGKTYLYSIEIKDIIGVSRFFYDSKYKKLNTIVRDIMSEASVDKETAENLLSAKESVWNLDLDHYDLAELDWWIQGLQGKAAKLMGYEAAEARDEQGIVLIVPMSGREKDLVLEGIF